MAQDDFNPARLARRLIRSVPRAALATVAADRGGEPYASLVSVAVDHDASPILLLSDLAEHTRNLRRDPRVSLLFDGTGGERRTDPLAGDRVTVQGRIEPSDEPRHRARYVARHPSAAGYAGFKDFNVYRVRVERAHLVGGFGRIHWIDGAEVLGAVADALAAREADIVGHMNDDHPDAVRLYATRLLGLPGDDGWVMTGVDPEGADLRAGGRTARLEFDRAVSDAEGARVELVRLVKRARAAAQGEEEASSRG